MLRREWFESEQHHSSLSPRAIYSASFSPPFGWPNHNRAQLKQTKTNRTDDVTAQLAAAGELPPANRALAKLPVLETPLAALLVDRRASRALETIETTGSREYSSAKVAFAPPFKSIMTLGNVKAGRSSSQLSTCWFLSRHGAN